MIEKALERAQDLVSGERQSMYGPPGENWQRTASIWSGILDRKVLPEEAMLCMMGVKLARLSQNYSDDSLVDLLGYLILYPKEIRREP